ncbi:ubinuclein-1 isoform X2 [Esox lucius]|uniref:ubinuclein-1 isoform X2 n=1 Tax=Esox lucius TaxID=8010 RepID=UPI001476C012|nr:ubinuclein-1 isoform X2 [Esox lucius]
MIVAMAEPRRVQLTTLSSNVPLQSIVVVKPVLAPKDASVTDTPVEASLSQGSPTKQPAKTERFVLTLFEPDQHSCPEFYYAELVNQKTSVSDEDVPSTFDGKENREKDELETIARAFEEKYGTGSKRKKDRVQDLVDIGEGYDNEDSFIDNSEAYDELVPASLTTKLGGFYVNSGPLQFRQASDTETDDDFVTKNKQSKSLKKRKFKDGEVKPKKKAKRIKDGLMEMETSNSSMHCFQPDDGTMSQKPKKKKKKPAGPLSVTDMLRKFQKQKDKEKLKRQKEREQQKLTLEQIQAGSPMTTLPIIPFVPADAAGGGANMADPLMSLIGLTNDRAFLQAASTVDFDLDLDTLLDASAETPGVLAVTLANQNINENALAHQELHGLESTVLSVGVCAEPSAFTLESDTQKPQTTIIPLPKREPQTQLNIDPVPQPQDQICPVPELMSKSQAANPPIYPQPVSGPLPLPAPLPDGLSPALERRIQDLILAAKGLGGESKLKFFTQEVNTILLDIELQCRDVSGQVRSKVYTHLASFLPCSRETLLKRVKKLLLTQEPLQRLREAIGRVMPEQISRYHNDCQAHTEARVAKMVGEGKEREQKNAGSEEEGEERSGKRVLGPRKQFRWTEEIRSVWECLCNVVRVRMDRFEVEKGNPVEAEEFLKTFLDMEVKPLWPKGWMQPRVLLKESRRVYSPGATLQQAKRKVKSEKRQSSLDGAPITPGTSNVLVDPQAFLGAQPENGSPQLSSGMSTLATHLDDTAEHGAVEKELNLLGVEERSGSSVNTKAQSATVNTHPDSPLNMLADQALAQGQLSNNYISQEHLAVTSDLSLQNISPPPQKKKKPCSEVSSGFVPGHKPTLGNKAGLPGIPLLHALGFPITSFGPGMQTQLQHSKDAPVTSPTSGTFLHGLSQWQPTGGSGIKR